MQIAIKRGMKNYFDIRGRKMGRGVISLLYKPTSNLKTMNNQTYSPAVESLTGAWKVLFNASYQFEIQNGADHETAEFLALRSVHRKKNVAKNLTFKH
jgi:hypothetical protein